MSHAAKLARDETITEALRAANDALGDEEPTNQAFRVIAAIKALRHDGVRVTGSERIDYLERVQKAVQRAWLDEYDGAVGVVGDPKHDAIAGIDTPIGRLKAITFRRQWKGGRIAWATEYYLDDQPITIREIRAAGLAQRPTTRNRQKRGPTK